MANAADLPVAPPPPPPMATPAFDWSGPYIGIYAGFFRPQAAANNPGPIPRAGIQAGYNIIRGRMLAGIEMQAGLYGFSAPLTLEGNLNARLGLLLGERFLLFTESGIGVLYAPSAPPAVLFWSLTGGLEIALGQKWSIFAEGGIARQFSAVPPAIVFEAGLNWHPRN